MNALLLDGAVLARENEIAVAALCNRLLHVSPNTAIDLTAFAEEQLPSLESVLPPIWGVRLVSDAGNPMARSGWITSRIQRVTNFYTDPSTKLFAYCADHWTDLTQFSLVKSDVVLLACGPLAQLAIITAVEALMSFDPMRFDEDGYQRSASEGQH